MESVKSEMKDTFMMAAVVGLIYGKLEIAIPALIVYAILARR